MIKKKAKGQETIVKGKEIILISSCHATGKARQVANQKKPKRKYLIQKGEIYIERKQNPERKETIDIWTSIREHCLLFVVFSRSAYNILSIVQSN